MIYSLAAFTLLIASAWGETPQALQDKVTNLPGQPDGVNFDQYAGYVNLAGTEKDIFYWLQMSDSSDRNIPVVIWTNGGPGCSGLLGAMLEQGAFRIQSDGSLLLNPGRWNQLAHMVFIEQPAGVGYSYSGNSNDYDTGDAQAVADMYSFIEGFFKVFPELESNDFYISSESYGGHYMPQLAKYIVDNNDGSINFKGFLVGNPYTDPVENAKGMYDTFWGHSVISKPLYDSYQSACDDGKNWDQQACQDQMNTLEKAVGDLYLYGIDWPVCHSSSPYGRLQQQWFIKKVLNKLGRGFGFAHTQLDVNALKDIYDPCQEDYTETYLNRADVQNALHAKSTAWHSCSGKVKWNGTDFEQYMEPYYKYLVEGGYNLHILVFSGDDDTVCGTWGTQSWIWNLGYEADGQWESWTIEEPDHGDQVGGYKVQFNYQNKKALTFATIHSAGHQVPWFKPKKGYWMFQQYMEGNL